MPKLKEISLSNGQILTNIKYDGTKEDFEKARKTEFDITLERTNTTTDIIYLLTDTIVYYVFSNE